MKIPCWGEAARATPPCLRRHEPQSGTPICGAKRPGPQGPAAGLRGPGRSGLLGAGAHWRQARRDLANPRPSRNWRVTACRQLSLRDCGGPAGMNTQPGRPAQRLAGRLDSPTGSANARPGRPAQPEFQFVVTLHAACGSSEPSPWLSRALKQGLALAEARRCGPPEPTPQVPEMPHGVSVCTCVCVRARVWHCFLGGFVRALENRQRCQAPATRMCLLHPPAPSHSRIQ